MKKCPYCGKEYPDDVSSCAIDSTSLEPSAPVLVAETAQGVEECQGGRLIAICDVVSRVNEQWSEYTFGVDRAVKVEFRGQEICLVAGEVGTYALTDVKSLRGGWSRCKGVYALAESEDQIAWMVRNADVFKLVQDDSTFPVFWVAQPLLRHIS